MDGIAEALHDLLQRRRTLAQAGERLAGWKVAFGSKQAQARLRLPHLLVGFLTAGNILSSGATVRVQGWQHPTIEPEIAVFLGSDLPPHPTDDEVWTAVEGIAVAFELVDILHPPEQDWTATVRANVFHKAAVVGSPVPVTRPDPLRGKGGQVTVNGEQTIEVTDLEANPGRVVDVLREAAGVLAQFGERLQAGEVILCGSVVPPIPVAAKDTSYRFAVEGVGDVVVYIAP